MAANDVTMFYTREKPWRGLGTMVKDAPTSADALRLSGLDWRLEEARNTLLFAKHYMRELNEAIEHLNQIKLSDYQVMKYIDALFPLYEDPSGQQKKNLMRLKEGLKLRYFEAPDLVDREKNVYCFINAVSNFATHAEPVLPDLPKGEQRWEIN